MAHDAAAGFQSFNNFQLQPAGPVDLAGAPSLPPGVASDPKSVLNAFCQRYCRKVITKSDIVYQAVRYGHQFQATVTLNFLAGVQFAGEVAGTSKEAEQNAARITLNNYPEEVAAAFSQQSSSTKGKKRKDSSAGPTSGATPLMLDPDGGNAKVILHNLLMRMLRRPMGKSDIVFTTNQTLVGYQCQVSLPCLTGEWAGLAWAGEVASKKKAAEETAAKQAVDSLLADPCIAALATSGVRPAKLPKNEKVAAAAADVERRLGLGASMPKAAMALPPGVQGPTGPGGPSDEDVHRDIPSYMLAMVADLDQPQPPPQQSLPPPAGGIMRPDAKGKGKADALAAKGKGKGKVVKPRTRVLEAPCSGSIFEWKGTFGWIDPAEPIDHPAARKYKGKIFLDIWDWCNENIQPAVGAAVQFHVYEDVSGLGAEQCWPL